MKKLIALFIAALFIVPAIATADDRVKVSGSYNVQGRAIQNAGNDWNDNTPGDEQDYYWGRLRVNTDIMPSDNTQIRFRMDLDENGYWGDNGYVQSATAPRDNTPVQLDKAWGQVDQELWTLRIGMQPYVFGTLINETLARGFRLTVKTPVVFELYYGKIEEGGNQTDTTVATDDSDYYAAKASYSADFGRFDAFYVTVKDDNSRSDMDVFGLFYKGSFGAVNVQAEANFFGGSDDDGNAAAAAVVNGLRAAGDAYEFDGTQFFAQVDANITEPWLIGAQLHWAEGNNSPTVDSLQHINDLGDFTLADYGPLGTWAPLLNAFNLGDIAGGNAVDGDAGIFGFVFITDYQFNEKILFQASLGYFEPEETAATDIDNIVTVSAGVKYQFLENVAVSAQYNGAWVETTTGLPDDPASALMWGLDLTF